MINFSVRSEDHINKIVSDSTKKIIEVTSLAEKGPGTLQACLKINAPRICIFKITGTISLKKALRIQYPFVEIAGKSAPLPGIILSGAGLKIETHDVSVDNLQIRIGDSLKGPDPQSRDGVSIGSDKNPVYNVTLDHLSISWAIDENLGIWYPDTHDITIKNCIISEALNNSIHPKGPHSKGVLVGDGIKRVSLKNNLLAHNFERNPYFKPGSTGEVINNVIYDWGNRGGHNIANVTDTAGVGEPVLLNFIGNYFKMGINSYLAPSLHGNPIDRNTRLYVKDNIGPTRLNITDEDWLITNIPQIPHRSAAPVMPLINAEIMSSKDAFEYVLKNAGSHPERRNDTDTRIINEVRSGTGDIKDCLKGCSRSVFPR